MKAFEEKHAQEIIRCKDCINAFDYCENGDVVCTHVDSNGSDTHHANWFCADGEYKKKDDE